MMWAALRSIFMKKMNAMRKWLLVTAMVSLMHMLGNAQASVEVTVYDLISLEPVGDVDLLLENDQIEMLVTARVSEDGKARFAGMPVIGRYRIRFEGDAVHAATETEWFELRANATRSVNLLLPLKISEALDEVVVRTESPT